MDIVRQDRCKLVSRSVYVYVSLETDQERQETETDWILAVVRYSRSIASDESNSWIMSSSVARWSAVMGRACTQFWQNTSHIGTTVTHNNISDIQAKYHNNLIGKNFHHRMLFRDIYYLFVLCYCISFYHFNVYVENFQSYVPLYLYVHVDVWFASVRPK